MSEIKIYNAHGWEADDGLQGLLPQLLKTIKTQQDRALVCHLMMMEHVHSKGPLVFFLS